MNKIGIDVGSTTIKVFAMKKDKLVYQNYVRHSAKIKESILHEMKILYTQFQMKEAIITITGSAGLGLAEKLNIPFVQEVIASTKAIETFYPKTNVIIELGGEDAKIIYLGNQVEQRMNGTCAGGTGAFVDQMAVLLNCSVEELNEYAKSYDKIYPIASRCGVFAKTDIQPLINQGARKENLAASIFQAVVNQTIAGLSQGRKIEGNVAFLGGPLFFYSELRQAFIRTLHLSQDQVIFPENAHYFVAMGSTMCGHEKVMNLNDLIINIENLSNENTSLHHLQPLFHTNEEYVEFKKRHDKAYVKTIDIDCYQGNAYLGIDCGSTTTKMILLSEENEILFSFYASNGGNPVQVVQEQLLRLLEMTKDKITILSSCVTGYGEELIQSAFSITHGIVETVAHFKSAQFFNKDVSYIIDIGGQDMKCFKIVNQTIDSIFLNEACSSGCGSFVESFASALGYKVKDFAQLGLLSAKPCDLGSRCTVFMNSSVKQAQKDGASVEDVSAGLAYSVVKNALYKVIRINDIASLGKHMVVQGGTFLNDGILRAFELETKTEVIRPNIAGLMGAFGCALFAKMHPNSLPLTLEKVKSVQFTSIVQNCKICENNCLLTINKFQDGHLFISGNRCERGQGKIQSNQDLNMYAQKMNLLQTLPILENGKRGKLGIPFVLNFYDNYPFWNGFFYALGIELVISDFQSKKSLYFKGQDSIPSDTVCYPAKIVHGHIKKLIEKEVNKIFYPIIPYNFKEKEYVDNHYNCPVVSYYPELIKANMSELHEITYISPYVQLGHAHFNEKIYEALKPYYPDITKKEIRLASKKGSETLDCFRLKLQELGDEIIAKAMDLKYPIIVLAGRPYHLDKGVNHFVDQMISSFHVAILSEEVVAAKVHKNQVAVLNQWTYHSRLYDAATFCANHPSFHLVQLVSFGCGLDAITTDETRSILEKSGKLYTQIKIDEISNLGAVKIRIRSLLEAIKERE